MKKIILFFVLQLTVVSMYAQHTDKGIKLSCNAGFLYSNLLGGGTRSSSWIYARENPVAAESDLGYVDSPKGKEFIPGYKAGLGVIVDFTKAFALNIDINYEQKGSKIPISKVLYRSFQGGRAAFPLSESSDNYAKLILRQIVVPVKAELRYKMIYISPGLYMGMLLEARERGEIHIGDHHDVVVDNNYKEHCSFMDFGALMGVGVNIPLSQKQALKVGIGGAWSVTGNNAHQWGRVGVPIEPIYSQSFSLELKYEFKIK
jgi:hypothetical protein